MLFKKARGRREKIVGGHYSRQLPVVHDWQATNLGASHNLDRFQRRRGRSHARWIRLYNLAHSQRLLAF